MNHGVVEHGATSVVEPSTAHVLPAIRAVTQRAVPATFGSWAVSRSEKSGELSMHSMVAPCPHGA